jgi:hypothetical protein
VDSKRVVVSQATKALDVRKLLKLGKVRAGAKVEIDLLRNDSIGLIKTLAFKTGQPPAVTTRCARPGSTKTEKCP